MRARGTAYRANELVTVEIDPWLRVGVKKPIYCTRRHGPSNQQSRMLLSQEVGRGGADWRSAQTAVPTHLLLLGFLGRPVHLRPQAVLTTSAMASAR